MRLLSHCLFLVLAWAAALPAAAFEVQGLSLQPNGTFAAGGLRLAVGHWGGDWSFTSQADRLAVAPGFPRDMADTWELQGQLQPRAGGPIALAERLQTGPDGRVQAEWRVSHPTGIATQTLALVISVPVAAGADRAVVFEGAGGRAEFRLPANFGPPGANLGERRGVSRLVLPTPAGTLEIAGADLRVSLHDGRGYGGRDFGVRVYFTPGAGTLREASLQLAIARFDRVVDSLPIAEAGPEWAAYEHVLDIEPGSVFDRSALADAPAGKHGRVVASPQGRLVFEGQPDRPLRFWGTNLTFDTQFMTPAQSDMLAERLQRAGYNAVRLHHFERDLLRKGGPSDAIDPRQLDRLEYLFAALKRRGIYVMPGLYSNRSFPPDEVPEIGRELRTDLQQLIPVSDNAFAAWSRFAEKLLTHRNPYTGLTWAEDPALMAVYMLNEETLFMRGFAAFAPDIRALYEQRYLSWRAQQPAPVAETGPEAAAAFNHFLVETKRAADARQMAFLRSLGVKALLTGDSNMDTEAQVFVRRQFDVVDEHEYWNHPRFLGGSWALPAAVNHSSVLASGLWLPRKLMLPRIFGKPYIVSEFGFVWPNAARAESGVLMAAYAGLQGWDALYSFDYATDASGVLKPSVQRGSALFDLVTDPVGMLADRAGAFLFLHGGVETAAGAVAYLADPRTAYAGARGKPDSLPDPIAWLGFLTRVGSLPSDAPDLTGIAQRNGIRAFASRVPNAPPAAAGLPLVGSDNSAEKRLAAVGVLPARSDPMVFRSETGQVEISRDRATAQLVTPQAECFVLPPRARLQGERVAVDNGGVQTAIYAMAVDGQPLAATGRVLVLHLTDSLNSGTRFSDGTRTRLEAVGRLPHLVKRGGATITLRLAGEGWQAWAVDASGRRLRPVSFERRDGVWVLPVQTAGETGTTLAYELLRS